METRELEGKTFSCLEGCGFCCTFQPEASQRELALLRARVKPRPLAVVAAEGRTYLALQNKCGACTLLERRGCQAYDLRPAHCRYFPFHVHFGERPEVYVNLTCRGVEHAAGRDLRGAFDGSVVSVAKRDEWQTHEREARETYAAFERRARKAGAWGDARAVAGEALAGAERSEAKASTAAPSGGGREERSRTLITRAWMERALARAGEDASADDMIADALVAFSAKDVTKRPFYLAPDLRWLTFEGPARLLEMDERGSLTPVRGLPALTTWQDAPLDVTPYMRELARRDVFVGSVYAIVDEHAYETTVEEATWFRLAEIAADLNVRARILAAMGVPVESLAAELVRFYDSTFLDAPTIGAFL